MSQSKSESTSSGGLVRVAARGHAVTIFRPGVSLTVNYSIDGNPVRLVFRTRYLDRGFSVPVAGDMWLDAEGQAEDVESAMTIFTNAGRDLAAVIALVMNAAVAPLEPEIGVETTAGLERRSFLQRFVPADRLALSSRFVDVSAVCAALERMANHPEKERLTRAISHYTEALNRWEAGSELPTLAYLFMGVEALKTAMWRHVARQQGVSKEALAAEWGYKAGGALKLDPFLNDRARRSLIFKDDPILQTARSVSDAFEHGFANAGKLYKPARDSLMKTAEYLRSAIFELLSLPGELQQHLLERYSKPRGLGAFEMYWRSTLVGQTEELAAPDEEYPVFEWQLVFEEASFNEDTDQYEFKPRNTLKAKMADGLQFEGGTFEMWDAGTFTPPPGETKQG